MAKRSLTRENARSQQRHCDGCGGQRACILTWWAAERGNCSLPCVHRTSSSLASIVCPLHISRGVAAEGELMRRRRFLNLACWRLESCAEELGDAGEGMEALQQGGAQGLLVSSSLQAAGGKLPPSLPSARDRLERRIGGGWAWTFGQCPGRRGCTGLLPPPPVRDIAMSHANPVRCLLHHHVRDLSNVQEAWYAIRGSSTDCVFVSSSVQSSSSPGSIRHGGGVGAAVTPGWTYSVRVCVPANRVGIAGRYSVRQTAKGTGKGKK